VLVVVWFSASGTRGTCVIIDGGVPVPVTVAKLKRPWVIVGADKGCESDELREGFKLPHETLASVVVEGAVNVVSIKTERCGGPESVVLQYSVAAAMHTPYASVLSDVTNEGTTSL
jgi:hypothetical protein